MMCYGCWLGGMDVGRKRVSKCYTSGTLRYTQIVGRQVNILLEIFLLLLPCHRMTTIPR